MLRDALLGFLFLLGCQVMALWKVCSYDVNFGDAMTVHFLRSRIFQPLSIQYVCGHLYMLELSYVLLCVIIF
jgi:hypothetical protein